MSTWNVSLDICAQVTDNSQINETASNQTISKMVIFQEWKRYSEFLRNSFLFKIPHTIPDLHVKPTLYISTRTADSGEPHTTLNLCVGAKHQLCVCTAAHKNSAAKSSILLILHALSFRRQLHFQRCDVAHQNKPINYKN